MATDLPQEATKRLQPKKQTLDDAYAIPANFLEIDVVNPVTHGVARTRFTDYEVRMRVRKPPPFFYLFSPFLSSTSQIFRSSNRRNPVSEEGTVTLNGYETNLNETARLWFLLFRERPGNGRCRSEVMMDCLKRISSKIEGVAWNYLLTRWLVIHWLKTNDVSTCSFRNRS